MKRTAAPPKPALMREAFDQAARGLGATHPNPAVGAVVAKGGRVLGKGYHHGPGTPHAEVEALREAGGEARGADLYVTLEPCCIHGRTPPCSEAILRAGIRRVIAGCGDPNPAVDGKGFEALLAAGIEVVRGFLEEEAAALDPAYRVFHRKRRPYVHLKWAQSIDGMAARPGGGYLTGDEALARVHRERYLSDAILVSAGTVLTDDPLLTVRGSLREKDLLRILLDRRGRLDGTRRVFHTCPEKGSIWVVRPEGVDGSSICTAEGVREIRLPAGGDGGIDLKDLLALLWREEIVALYVEAVGRLSWSFLRERLVDRLSIHVAPMLIGGRDGIPGLGGVSFLGGEGLDLRRASWEQLGDDRVMTMDFPDSTGMGE